MAEKVSIFDVSEYLDSEESIAAYLSAIIDENDPKLLLAAISDIAKARGMSKIASDSGLGRESLYKALNAKSKPRFETILKVLNSLGVKIGFKAIVDNKGNVATSKKYRSSKKSSPIKSQSSRRGSIALKHAGQKIES
jgi:probable addiction module antidote protein